MPSVSDRTGYSIFLQEYLDLITIHFPHIAANLLISITVYYLLFYAHLSDYSNVEYNYNTDIY